MTPFGKWLERHGIRQARAAEALGITRAYVSLLTHGKEAPRLKTVGKQIEKWTSSITPEDPVPVTSWFPYMRQLRGIKID